MRIASIVIVAALILLSGCAATSTWHTLVAPSQSPEVTIMGTTKKEVSNTIVATMLDSGALIRQITEHSAIFGKPDDSSTARQIFGAQLHGAPEARVTFNFADVPGGVQVFSSVVMVSNPGSGTETVTDFTNSHMRLQLQGMLEQLREQLEPNYSPPPSTQGFTAAPVPPPARTTTTIAPAPTTMRSAAAPTVATASTTAAPVAATATPVASATSASVTPAAAATRTTTAPLPACPDAFHYATWTNCVGTLTSRNGQKYIGGFRGGRLDGQGTLTVPDGRKYVGGFREGRRHGHGTLFGPNDAVLQSGVWANDVLVGGH